MCLLVCGRTSAASVRLVASHALALSHLLTVPFLREFFLLPIFSFLIVAGSPSQAPIFSAWVAGVFRVRYVSDVFRTYAFLYSD
ncbi:hypothetical protein VTO73DRAFT_12446 [Trametes versicolor]